MKGGVYRILTFDYKAYYQGMLYYYKNMAGKNSNISRDYFDKLYKMYAGY